MGFLQNTFTLFDFFRGRSGKTQGQTGFVHVSSSDSTNAGESVTVDNLLNEPTTLTCVNIIVQGITQVPYLVKRKTPQGLERLERHPITKLLNRPNEYQTASEFKSSIVSTILIHGNAFIYIARSNKNKNTGKPMQLIPLDPKNITLGTNKFGLPTYNHEEYGDIDNKNIIHIRDLTLFVPAGSSRLLLASEIIGCKIAADSLMAEHFRNGISLNYTLTYDRPPPPAKLKEIEMSIESSLKRRGQRRGGFLSIQGGQFNAIKGSTPADSDLRELRKDLIEEICGLLRVPSYLAGGDGSEKYNNVKQKLTSLHRDTFYPIINNIQEAMSLKLLENKNECIYFDTTDLLKGDTDGQSKYAQGLVASGIISINEGREYLGYSTLDGEGFDMPKVGNTMPEDEATGGEDGPQSNDNLDNDDNDEVQE